MYYLKDVELKYFFDPLMVRTVGNNLTITMTPLYIDNTRLMNSLATNSVDGDLGFCFNNQ